MERCRHSEGPGSEIKLRAEGTKATDWAHPPVDFGTFCKGTCSDGQSCCRMLEVHNPLSRYSSLLCPPAFSASQIRTIPHHHQVWITASRTLRGIWPPFGEQKISPELPSIRRLGWKGKRKLLFLGCHPARPLHHCQERNRDQAEQKGNRKVFSQPAFYTGRRWPAPAGNEGEIRNSLQPKLTPLCRRKRQNSWILGVFSQIQPKSTAYLTRCTFK